MHELGIAQEVVEIAASRTVGRKVTRLVLEIGKLSAVLPDAIRFCFDLCCQGTNLEGAMLEIVEIPGRARCRECSAEIPLEQAFGRCDCGCSDLTWLSGEELRIKELEVVECA
jgi:hydrogenase nickel incorporation protein HypA/HybF